MYTIKLVSRIMKRTLWILLCWGLLSTLGGCYVAPYPYYEAYAAPNVPFYPYHATYP
jgi:hypothetical protein